MARPRKPADKLHNNPLKIWISDEQEALIRAIAERRGDMPLSVLGREMLLVGLERWQARQMTKSAKRKTA